MSLSQLPTELLIDIVSYLPTPIKGKPWYDCETGPNPESNFQDLSALFALSLANRRFSNIVTPILHDLAVEETRRCFKVINGDYRKDCIGHYPGALALAIRTGNLRLTQELFKHIPPGEFPPDDGISYFVEGMSHWERRFVSDSDPGFIIERVRHTESM